MALARIADASALLQSDAARVTWMGKQKEYPLLYWKGKDNETEYLCWGISRHLQSLSAIPQHDSFPVFGAFAFDQNTPQWPGFQSQLIWSPRWYLEINEASFRLFHLVSPVEKLHLPSGELPRNDIHLPNKKRWFSHISSLKNIFAKQDLRKLVLSYCIKHNIPLKSKME